MEFFYPDTGRNINPLCQKKHGPILPVEFINSSVLALGISGKSSHNRALMLSTLDPFSEAGLKRLLGLAQHLSQGWCSRVILSFPDYDRLAHGNLMQAAKSSFFDARFVETTEVHCYDPDFRTLIP